MSLWCECWWWTKPDDIPKWLKHTCIIWLLLSLAATDLFNKLNFVYDPMGICQVSLCIFYTFIPLASHRYPFYLPSNMPQKRWAYFWCVYFLSFFVPQTGYVLIHGKLLVQFFICLLLMLMQQWSRYLNALTQRQCEWSNKVFVSS